MVARSVVDCWLDFTPDDATGFEMTRNDGKQKIAKHSSLKSWLLAVNLPPNAFFN
ncbi:MAG: hypothetical protein ICV52_10165 [Microcoleus sp. C1-bin4]|nr:hypothetical protein [Microcoleus sp. C1-bin4]